jgi:hypothetical protein
MVVATASMGARATHNASPVGSSPCAKAGAAQATVEVSAININVIRMIQNPRLYIVLTPYLD